MKKANNYILFFAVILIAPIGLLAQNSNYEKVGLASFYADKFEGRQTANGEIYYHAKKTAAHRTLPFGSIVKVSNLENNKVAIVRINDRGPFVDGRIIDLSKSIAKELGFVDKGLAKVRIEVIANTKDIPDNKPQQEKSKETSYYKVSSQKVNPKGKGVQIGSYVGDENLIDLSSKLKSKFKEEIFIEIASVNEKKVYRIIVGQYQNENQLLKLKEKLSKDYPDCFIVSYK